MESSALMGHPSGRRIAVVALFAVGCGGLNSNGKSKVEVSFQSSTHLWDDGTVIAGNVCFHRTQYEIGTVPNATGALDLRSNGSRFVVAAVSPTERRIVGATTERGGGNESVDLRFGPDHLVGHIAWHQFKLQANGDHLEGLYQLNALPPVPVKFFGMETYWPLPIAEQGVLLPNLLMCTNNSPTHGFEIDFRDLKRDR